jgi:hypothetical protein
LIVDHGHSDLQELTYVNIDWFDAGRHGEVLFQRDAVKQLSAVVMRMWTRAARTGSRLLS